MKMIWFLLGILSVCRIWAQPSGQSRKDIAVFFSSGEPFSSTDSLAEALHTQFGFSTIRVAHADRDSLRHYLKTLKKTLFSNQDQLMLVFALDSVGEEQLQRWVEEIPCPRKLLIGAGSGIPPLKQNWIRPEPAAWEKHDNRNDAIKTIFRSNNATEKYIISGGAQADNTLSDLFFQINWALRFYCGSDGILSFRELAGVLDQMNEPHPSWGELGANTGEDFVFIGPEPVESKESTSELAQMSRDMDAWMRAEDQQTCLAYQQYRRDFCPGGLFCEAAKDKMASGHVPSPNARRHLMPAYRLARVEGGSFAFGCDSLSGVTCNKFNTPVQTLKVDGFLIGKYEVTQKEWRSVVGTDPAKRTDAECDDCPVRQFSLFEITQFFQKLNERTHLSYRLPTEAEWEFAAKGGLLSKGYRYAGSNDVGEVAWTEENAEGILHPGGLKKANELGIFDMTGNALEWTADCWYDQYDWKMFYYGLSVLRRSCSGFCSARGGSFRHRYPADYSLNITYRYKVDAMLVDMGFRIVLPLK